MRVLGLLLFLVGLGCFSTPSSAGAGVFFVILGLVLMGAGWGRRREKTVINNIVQVVNSPNASAADLRSTYDDGDTGFRAMKEPKLLPPKRGSGELEGNKFVDLRSEISAESKKVLAEAEHDGFELAFRRDMVTVITDQGEMDMRSNAAIQRFGRRQGYIA